MVNRAHFPRYYAGDQIKAYVLYLDYRMGPGWLLLRNCSLSRSSLPH